MACPITQLSLARRNPRLRQHSGELKSGTFLRSVARVILPSNGKNCFIYRASPFLIGRKTTGWVTEVASKFTKRQAQLKPCAHLWHLGIRHF